MKFHIGCLTAKGMISFIPSSKLRLCSYLYTLTTCPGLRQAAHRPLRDAAQPEQNKWPQEEKQQSTSAAKQTLHCQACLAASLSACCAEDSAWVCEGSEGR